MARWLALATVQVLQDIQTSDENPTMPLSPELQRLAADLDNTFAAEDREIVKEAKRE